MIKKIIKYCFFILIILGLIISTIFIMRDLNTIKNLYFTSEILIYKENVEYEVKVNNTTSQTVFRINDDEYIYFKYPREGKCRLSIPVFDTIESKNVLENLKPIVDYTYNVSFLDSCKYVKYLLDNGYELEMYVSTSQYVEFFMYKDNKYKRIVLFTDSLMVCDMIEGSEIPKVLDYLDSYDFGKNLTELFSETLKDK